MNKPPGSSPGQEGLTSGETNDGLGPAKLSTALREIHPGDASDFKGE